MSKDMTVNPEEFEFTISLELDDGTEIECVPVDTFSLEDRDYVALLPLEGPDKDSGTIYLYRAVYDEDGEMAVEYIDDDEEYESVADAYDELCDEEEFEEMLKD